MPTPYTEGNGCAYLWKTNAGYQCPCQGPEIVPCTCYSLVDAMKCEHFKPESWEVEEFINQLTDVMKNTIPVPLGNVKMVEETDNGIKVTARLTKEGKRIMDEIENDNVNHPSHYTAGGVECIDAIEAILEAHSDPVAGWLTAQCVKYLWRWQLKNGLEDLEKAKFYLDRLITREENDN